MIGISNIKVVILVLGYEALGKLRFQSRVN